MQAQNEHRKIEQWCTKKHRAHNLKWESEL